MRMPGLDLLRAIAIVWVMLFHSFIVGGLGDGYDWLSRYGWMGVDLFFVLSGFLIGSQLLAPLARGERLSLRGFYLRRAFRILPAFLAVLVLYLLAPGFREKPGLEPWWKFAAFIVNFNIDYTTNQAFSHAWSLCVEEHFYMLFPLLAWWMTRRPSLRNVVGVCIGVVLAGIALRSAIWLHDTALDPQRNWFVEDIYYPTWCRLDGLLAGVMLATIRTFQPGWWARAQSRPNAALLAGVAVVGIACWLFRDRVGLLGNSVGWPVLSLGLALLVFAGTSRASWIGRWRIPGAGWIAAISYSLYLTHKAVFRMVDATFGAPLTGHGLAAFALFAAASLLGGAMLHYLVERPFLMLRDRAMTARQSPELLARAT